MRPRRDGCAAAAAPAGLPRVAQETLVAVGSGGGVRLFRREVGVGRQVPALRVQGLPLRRRRVPVLGERPPRHGLHQVAVAAVALRSPQIRC